MSDLNQPSYYVRREQQERTLAAAAQSPEIRDIHIDMAERYACLTRAAEPAPARPRLKLVYT